MQINRDEKLKSLIQQFTAEFITRESNHASLITVTSISLVSEGNKAIVNISVLPENKENAALDFLNRQRRELRGALMKKYRAVRVPYLVFELDKGEKNRQRIEEISKTIE